MTITHDLLPGRPYGMSEIEYVARHDLPLDRVHGREIERTLRVFADGHGVGEVIGCRVREGGFADVITVQLTDGEFVASPASGVYIADPEPQVPGRCCRAVFCICP